MAYKNYLSLEVGPSHGVWVQLSFSQISGLFGSGSFGLDPSPVSTAIKPHANMKNQEIDPFPAQEPWNQQKSLCLHMCVRVCGVM